MGVRLGSLDGRDGDYSIYVLSAGKLLQHRDGQFLLMVSHYVSCENYGRNWISIPYSISLSTTISGLCGI